MKTIDIKFKSPVNKILLALSMPVVYLLSLSFYLPLTINT